MIKKVLLTLASLAVLTAALAGILYVTNPPPAVARIADDAIGSGKPYVVKLHAQWCPFCMLTKDEWSRIEEAYAARVNLLVLDFTNQANTDASQAEARRLGLEKFFDEYAGATGIVVVLDGRTKEVTAEIGGSRDFSEYRTAIDAALSRQGNPL
jgi:thiol-disulfide isomerase/thioredoxin